MLRIRPDTYLSQNRLQGQNFVIVTRTAYGVLAQTFAKPLFVSVITRGTFIATFFISQALFPPSLPSSTSAFPPNARNVPIFSMRVTSSTLRPLRKPREESEETHLQGILLRAVMLKDRKGQSTTANGMPIKCPHFAQDIWTHLKAKSVWCKRAEATGCS